MRPSGRTFLVPVALAAAVLLPAFTAADTVLLEERFSASRATPSWFSALDTEARVYAVRVQSPLGVAVRAYAETGAVQLHVFERHDDAFTFTVDRLAGMDWVPAREKVRQLPPGSWSVAVDPSTPSTVVLATFRGSAGLDTATFSNTWDCPTHVTRGCTP